MLLRGLMVMFGLCTFVQVWLVGWDSSVEERTQLRYSTLHVYSNILCHTLYTSAYLCIPLHTSAYLCISLHTSAYFCILLYTLALLSPLPAYIALSCRPEVCCTLSLFKHHQWESTAEERLIVIHVQCTYYAHTLSSLCSCTLQMYSHPCIPHMCMYSAQ